MKRESLLKQLDNADKVWDVVVVGGGATGLGCAVDAASRGYSVALFEREDFAKCTSSRSTKLVHGGVRYLQKLEVDLVREALHERGIMKRNAPHLVKDQAFVISNYSYWENFLYFCGLTFYDILSFGFGYGRSRFITPKTVMKYLPTSNPKGLKGGIVYHDGQFDDARMACNLAQTCVEQGGVAVNRMAVEKVLHDEKGKCCGVVARDLLSGREYTVKAKAVINAAGIFVDEVMQMDEPNMPKMVVPSQGVHLVLDMKFLQSDYAIMVPKTSDGRVLFAVPWHDKVVVGTTDIQRPTPESEPRPLDEEIEFILNTAGLYMNPAPTRADIVSVFAGQRPLAAPKKEGKKSKEVSRSHKIIVSDNDLITITGGKWTSYRKMAEDTIDKAIKLGKIEKRKCVTRHLRIHGYRPNPDLSDHMYVYGSDEPKIYELIKENPALGRKLSEKFDYTEAEVVWAVREEMALTVDDVLARRVRLPEGRTARSRNHGRRTRPRQGVDRRTGQELHRTLVALFHSITIKPAHNSHTHPLRPAAVSRRTGNERDGGLSLRPSTFLHRTGHKRPATAHARPFRHPPRTGRHYGSGAYGGRAVTLRSVRAVRCAAHPARAAAPPESPAVCRDPFAPARFPYGGFRVLFREPKFFPGNPARIPVAFPSSANRIPPSPH